MVQQGDQRDKSVMAGNHRQVCSHEGPEEEKVLANNPPGYKGTGN
jgi:hypothetical protein